MCVLLQTRSSLSSFDENAGRACSGNFIFAYPAHAAPIVTRYIDWFLIFGPLVAAARENPQTRMVPKSPVPPALSSPSRLSDLRSTRVIFFLGFDQSRHLFPFRPFVPHRLYLVTQGMLAVNLGCMRIVLI